MIDRNGTFEVVRRGGNFSVQVYSLDPIQKDTNKLCEKVEALNGTLDGSIDRGLVFTIPLSAGFSSIEKIFDEFVTSTPNTEWYYGNVYDPKDMETPLGWWLDLEKK